MEIHESIKDIVFDNSIEMQLSREFYDWGGLDKISEVILSDKIKKLAKFLKENKHRLSK
jgi:hypothetical protein